MLSSVRNPESYSIRVKLGRNKSGGNRWTGQKQKQRALEKDRSWTVSMASSEEEGAKSPFSQGESVFTVTSITMFQGSLELDCVTAWLMPVLLTFSHNTHATWAQLRLWSCNTKLLGPSVLKWSGDGARRCGWKGGLSRCFTRRWCPSRVLRYK